MADPTRAMVAFHCCSDGLSSMTGSIMASPTPTAMIRWASAESETSASMPPKDLMCAISAMAFARRWFIRSDSIWRIWSSTCARVNASSSRMSQLVPGRS